MNALASDELVALIERKLAKHGIAKLIPDDRTLADAYRRMHQQAAVQAKIDELVEELDEDEVKVPAGLRRRIEKALKSDPARSWDAILREVAEQDQENDFPAADRTWLPQTRLEPSSRIAQDEASRSGLNGRSAASPARPLPTISMAWKLNIGVQMGPMSSGLTDVDLDCREALVIGRCYCRKATHLRAQVEAVLALAIRHDFGRQHR